MDPGWDHTENEDKLLLAHTSFMATFMVRDFGTNVDSVVYISEVRSVSGIGCSNNYLSAGDVIDTLTKDYNKHILSIVINNVNLLFGLSPSPFEFPVLIYYIYQLCYLYSSISEICKICNSKCKCECTCKCESPSNGNYICLCLCESKAEAKGCCIFICKKDSCKCICICVCKKDCGSGADKSHTCNECLVKIDLSKLQSQSCTILNCLRWIRCYISRIENKCCLCSCCQVTTCNQTCCTSCGSCTSPGVGRCCCCSCCVNGCCTPGSCNSYCCCKQGSINYSSIISRINSIESLFNQISTKIIDLRTLKNMLSLISAIANKCEKCTDGCCKDLDSLIDYIKKALKYYYLFGSRIGDIKLLVDYKTFCPQANEIIEKLRISVSPLLNKLSEIKDQVLINVDYSGKLNNMLVVVYSHYCIFQCFLAMYILLQSSSKVYSILYIIQGVEYCECVGNFKPNNNNGFKTTDFLKYLINCCGKNTEDPSKLFIVNDGNHMCLCLVIKYVLYPSLIKSFYYLRHVYLEALGKQTREFLTNDYIVTNINHMIKMVFIIIDVIYGVMKWIINNYKIEWTGYTTRVEIKTYCSYYNDPYYHYLISIILFISSLIENTWSMDKQSVKMDIECLSSLLSEYQSIHVYTKYYSPSRYSILRNIISGLLNGKLIQGTLSHSAVGVGEKDKGSLVSSRLTNITTITESKEKSGTTTSVISTTSRVLLNKSTKLGFMSFRSMFIGTEFSKEKFTLLYGKYSQLSFYTQNSNISIATMQTIRNPGMKISLDYLDKICKRETCIQSCCKVGDGVCKICPIAKIKINCLCISLKRIKLALGNVSGDLLLNYLMGSVNISRDFVTNLCVGFGEMYAIMLKNLIIWSRYPMNINNIENIGVTNVETINWGYDTNYEHDVTNDKGFSNQYPYVSSSYGTDINIMINLLDY